MTSEQNILDQSIETSKKVLKFAFIFSAASNILMLMLPIYTLQVLDRVVTSRSTETLIMLTLITVFMFGVFGLFQIVRSATLAKLGEWFEKKMGSYLLSSSLSVSAVAPGASGSQGLRDLAIVKAFISGPGLTALMDAPWSVLYLLVIFLINPWLCLITVIGCVALVFFALLNEKSVKGKLSEANGANIKAMNQVEMSARNSEVIEAMGMMDDVIAKWRSQNSEILDVQEQATARAGIITGIAKAFRMMLQIAVMGFGAWLVIHDEITVGGLIACSIITGRALAPFEAAISAWSSITAAQESYGRLQELVKNAPRREETIELPTPTGKIEAQKLTYVIPGTNKVVINNMNFTIAPGDVLGIIGPSASGKSTLAKLIVGVYKAAQGVLRLDGADVYTWARKDFGRHVGYLPQDVELFDGSVKENIARMKSNAEDEEIISAARMAGVHEMILHLPNGYETQIGVGGSNLSAGQRQRVGLARAFFGNPKLLVLDEPNSNLDDMGENALIQAIQAAKKLKITTFVIAHRPAVLSCVEKIMVIREGQITDYGERDEILRKYSAAALQQQQQQAQIAAQQQASAQQQNAARQAAAAQQQQIATAGQEVKLNKVNMKMADSAGGNDSADSDTSANLDDNKTKGGK